MNPRAVVLLSLLYPSLCTATGEEWILVEQGQAHFSIYAPGENELAGQRLAARLESLIGAKLAVHAGSVPPPGVDGFIAIGTPRTNALVMAVLENERPVDPLGEEGYLLRAAHWKDRPVVIAAGSTLAGVNNAVSELLSWKLKLTESRVSVPGDLNESDRPALKYRLLWAWDSLVNFSESIEEMNRVQSFPATLEGPVWFNKNTPASYLKHFEAAVDYACDHKLNGYIIWGFMRDETGGLETGRAISQYARRRNVRILPGVCTENAYGGFTFCTDSKYSLDAWTKQHPELKFKHPKGPIEPGICPSKAENEQWLREGTRWFFENLPDVGGMNLENGDWMLCSTEDCTAARAKPENDPNFLWDQMKTYGPVLEEARRLRPDAWMTFATYIGMTEPAFSAEMKTAIQNGFASDFVYPPRMSSQLPEFGIAQWTFSHMIQHPQELIPAGSRPPAGRINEHIGFMHQGSIWGARSDANRWWAAPAASLDDASEAIRLLCLNVHQMGMQGVVLKGQIGPASPANELNYLAMEYFGWHPQRSGEDFLRDRLAVCYGGAEKARLFLRLLRNTTRDQDAIQVDRRDALESAQTEDFDVRQRTRWQNLADELARRIRILTAPIEPQS